MAERGIARVTMDDVAEAAGVGKGTVYRAFGGRGGLAEALVDDAERALQEKVLRGAPPLGPGADPEERLRAFADSYLRFLEANLELLIETDHHVPGGRFATGAYAFWRTHITELARESGDSSPRLTAELVLSLLAADLHDHLRRDLGLRPTTAREAVVQAVAALVTRGR